MYLLYFRTQSGEQNELFETLSGTTIIEPREDI